MSINLERTLRRQQKSFYTDTELRALLLGTLHSKKAIIKRAVQQHLLIRLKRGLYCVNSEISRKKLHSFELAQFIYGPSCISLESVLSYHGLIPEAVYTTTSVTIKCSKSFKTPLGIYDFHKVPTENFLIHVNRIEINHSLYFMASPWRALLDFIYCYKKN